MNAKLILSLVFIAGSAGAYSFYGAGTSSLGTLRLAEQEALAREESARVKHEKAQDDLLRAIYFECLDKKTRTTGLRFVDQQKQAYECFKQQTLGTWTVTPATTGAPKRADTLNIQTSAPKLSDHREKYWQAYNVAVQTIQKWEGLRLKAYWDHSQCSIGYGFSAKCGSKISREQADAMLSSKVKEVLPDVMLSFPSLSSEQHGILVSFAHNCPRGYEDIKHNGLTRHSLWCKTAGGKVLRGLVSRRSEEGSILKK